MPRELLLGSADPERLKKWYLDGFHAEVDGYGNLIIRRLEGNR